MRPAGRTRPNGTTRRKRVPGSHFTHLRQQDSQNTNNDDKDFQIKRWTISVKFMIIIALEEKS
jgi:hypothetical protein